MKTKKMVIAVLTAALLISAALIAGCTNPLDGISVKQKPEDNYQIPAGKGIVRFKISDGDARTILPTPILVNAMYFRVEFTSGGTTFYYPSSDNGVTAAAAPLIGSAINTTPLALSPGIYSITITAFKDAAGLLPIAGWASASPHHTITGSGSTTVTANLKGITTSGADGTFSYNITVAAGIYTVHEMDILEYPSNDSIFESPDTPIQLTGNKTDTLDLPPGYYTVKVTLSNTNYLTRQYVRALHIYSNMTSTMPAIIVPALVQNVFQVSFDENNGQTNTNSTGDYSTQDVGYGNYADAPAAPTAGGGYSFGGWFQNSGGTGTAWDFASDRVLTDYDLYAKWIAPGATGTANFTLTFTFNDAATATPSATSISRDDLFDVVGTTYSFTLGAAPGNGSWNNVEWHIPDITPSTIISHMSGNNLVINTSSDFYSILALADKSTPDNILEITVIANLTGNTTDNTRPNGPYSATVEITVTP